MSEGVATCDLPLLVKAGLASRKVKSGDGSLWRVISDAPFELSACKKATSPTPRIDSHTSTGEDHGACDGAAAIGTDTDFQVLLGLTLARFSAELGNGLEKVAIAVKSTGRELSTIGIEWELTVEGDSSGTFHEGTSSAFFTNPKGFKPPKGQEGEARIEIAEVEIRGRELRLGPKVLGCIP